MQCARSSAGDCHSCEWLSLAYTEQIKKKQHNLLELLPKDYLFEELSPIVSQQTQFRNKAKMVVSGSVEKPILGLKKRDGVAVDLCQCPLYPTTFEPVFQILKTFIAKAGLVPYDVERRRGELKFILLTESRCNSTMLLRFVLRSEKKLQQLRQVLPWLQAQLPRLAVISVNIQPIHMAILEGEKEIILTEKAFLNERFNQIPLHIRPKGFFQTNPEVATSLYATAGHWVRTLKITRLWDLFCGTGGFGLHCADKTTELTGIEISPEAIECARLSASELGLDHVEFQALDSTGYALAKEAVPELVLVNPPRRGIGEELCGYLNAMKPHFILYSSCNAQTMAKDIALLSHYRIDRVQLFDMFPHTPHYEVLTLLILQDS